MHAGQHTTFGLPVCVVACGSAIVWVLILRPEHRGRPHALCDRRNHPTAVHARFGNGCPHPRGGFGVPGYMAALAYDPAKDVLYGTTTGNNNLYSISRSAGAATLIGGLGVDFMHGLAFDTQTGKSVRRRNVRFRCKFPL